MNSRGFVHAAGTPERFLGAAGEETRLSDGHDSGASRSMPRTGISQPASERGIRATAVEGAGTTLDHPFAFDGVQILGRTAGLALFYPVSFRQFHVRPTQCGWQEGRHVPETWTHPELRDHYLQRDGEKYGWRILQRFASRPRLSLALRAGRELLGDHAEPEPPVVLPLRLRLPLEGACPGLLPTGNFRALAVPGTSPFLFSDVGVDYEIRLTASRWQNGNINLWLELFVGGEYRTKTGNYRSLMYVPDLRRLRDLTPGLVPQFVAMALDALVSVSVHMNRRHGLVVDRRARAGNLRIATLRAVAGRHVMAVVRLPAVDGRELFVTAPGPHLYQKVRSQHEARLIVEHLNHGGT